MRTHAQFGRWSFSALAALLTAWTLPAQGPGSCGFHLDILSADTSTHSPIADMPATVTGIVPGAPGNPYDAYAPPGTAIRLVVSVPFGTLGPFPLGAGSPITIVWSVGALPIPSPFPGLFLPTCGGGPPIVGVLPLGGTIVDGIGLFGAPPIVPTADPGFPSRFSVTLMLPPFPLPPINFQAVVMLGPFGLTVTNAVSILTGPSPFQVSLIPGLVPSGAAPATDDGQFVGLPTPPGFAFYGVPTAMCDVDVNGFIDFCPGAAACGGSDFSSGATAAGCAPVSALVRPRINADHFDVDLLVPPPVPLIAGLSVEFAPPGPGWPARTIVRWKNVMPFAALAGSGLSTTFTAELWGDSRIVVQRQGSLLGPIGIGPGGLGMGYGGPSPGAGDTCGFVGGIPFSALWGIGAFAGPPAGVIEQDGGAFQLALGSLAVVFTPIPAAPGAYVANSY
jgi:hypothetical protein